jgi:outer membrane protein
METIIRHISIIGIIILFISGQGVSAQPADSTHWTLQDCIQYALKKNVTVRGSELTYKSNTVYADQARASQLPSLNASVNENFNWSKSNSTTDNFSGANSSSYGVNSSVTLFNGSKLTNTIKQADLNLQSSNYDIQTNKETVSLNVLNAYLQVLYAQEAVTNAQRQIESTTGQVNLAQEKLTLRVISRSDYLQVKSELASEKLTLANANRDLAIARLNLMQMMELPVSDKFQIVSPGLDSLVNQQRNPNPQNVYLQALGFKPQVKSVELSKESAVLDVNIAKAGYLPKLSLDAGVNTGYSSLLNGSAYRTQISDRLTPSVGLTLSIPIFDNKQVKSSVELAKIGTQNAELNEIDVKNQLRKEIEQACTDVSSAQIEYEASVEKYDAANESYLVAEEKYRQGLINSVDFLVQKTNQITSESNLLQSKFNLIFSYKILDFYSGVPLTL